MDRIDRLKGVRVLVVGDVMVDGYATEERETANARLFPGGAANAAANVATLGGKPILVGVVGDDPTSAALDRLLTRLGIDPATLILDPHRPTTTKIYLPDRPRKSVESTEALPQLTADQLFSVAAQAVVHVDAVLLSDYGKGVLAKSGAPALIRLARSHGKPVIVDPWGSAPWRYDGAAIMKPNLEELKKLAGGSDETDPYKVVHDCIPRVHKEVPAVYLTTCGAAGMVLSEDGRSRVFDPFPVKVECERGAGDSAAAALSLAVGSGMNFEEAATLANLAGAAAVQEPGTAVVTPQSLRRIVRMMKTR